MSAMAETYDREVRDLQWSEYLTTVVIELYRLRCGVKAEKVPQLPGKAPFSERIPVTCATDARGIRGLSGDHDRRQ